MFNLSEKVKAIIIVILDVVAVTILGFAPLFGWDLPMWATITDMIVIILANIFGVVWVVPDKDK